MAPEQLVQVISESLESLVRAVFLVSQPLQVSELCNLPEVTGAAALGHGVATKGYANLAVTGSAHLKIK